MRIGVLADLQTDHVGRHEHVAVERLSRRRPDLILDPGELFQGRAGAFERELPALRRLLGRLSAPGGVYVVEGYAGTLGRLARVVRGTGARVLDDEIAAPGYAAAG